MTFAPRRRWPVIIEFAAEAHGRRRQLFADVFADDSCRGKTIVTADRSPDVLIFAYGSNMCVERMLCRVSTASRVTIGYVPHRTIVFHKRTNKVSAWVLSCWRKAAPHLAS